MTIKYLIVDPSFFTAKKGLKKLTKLQNQIAEYELSKTHASKIKSRKLKVSTTSGGTRTISPAGTGSTRNQTGFTYEELEKHRPTLVLSSVLKALDNLQSGKTNEDDEIKNNQELKEVFKAWGVKDFATRIKDLHHGKELVQFFNENKIKYATENEFKYDPEKIGENCIFREVFDSLGEIGNTIYQQLATCYVNKRNSLIATCNRIFQKYISRLGIVRVWSSSTVGLTAYFFNIGETLTEFAPDIIEYIPPELSAPMVAIAYPVAFSTRRGIQYMRKRRTKQEVEKEKKENFFIKEEIDRECKEKGFLVQAKFPPQMSPYR